jgi:hypothetical protein
MAHRNPAPKAGFSHLSVEFGDRSGAKPTALICGSGARQISFIRLAGLPPELDVAYSSNKSAQNACGNRGFAADEREQR